MNFRMKIPSVWCCVTAIVVAAIIVAAVVVVIIYDSEVSRSYASVNDHHVCRISNLDNALLGYPYGSNSIKYTVNFNASIMQANYVSYYSTSGGNGCYTTDWKSCERAVRADRCRLRIVAQGRIRQPQFARRYEADGQT